jgi:hypothetical protein
MTFQFLVSDAVAGSPSYSAGTWRLAMSGLYVSSGPLAARTGALSVDSFVASLAGTTVSIGPGRAIVQGATTSTQGPYPVAMPTTYSQALAAASSQDRIDLFYLRIWDNEVDASGSTFADIVYLQGTPAGSPVAPTIPAGQAGFRICTVSVPHTGAPALTQVGVMPYTAAAGGIIPAYTTGSPAAPEAGQVRWRADRLPTVAPGPLEIWDATGSLWDPIVPDSYPRGSIAAPVSTTTIGNAVSTPEAADTVLGYLQATLVAGRRYRVGIGSYLGNGVAGEVYLIRIRDSGSASNPTNTSAMIAEIPFHPAVSGTSGRRELYLEDTFISASSGVHTFGVFAVRAAGTSSFTPISPANDSGTRGRSLWIRDEGTV